MTESENRILIVDDEESMRRFLSILLEKEGYQVSLASSGEEALQQLKERSFGLLITDLKMPGMNGVELLEHVTTSDPTLPVVILTAFASDASAVEAMEKGAYQYLEKKAKNDEIVLVVKNALSMRRIQSENQLLKSQIKRTHTERRIIGKADSMQKVFAMVDKVAQTDSTILI